MGNPGWYRRGGNGNCHQSVADGDKECADELVKLLEQGDSRGRRLLAEVTPSRMVRILRSRLRICLARLLADGQIRNTGDHDG